MNKYIQKWTRRSSLALACALLNCGSDDDDDDTGVQAAAGAAAQSMDNDTETNAAGAGAGATEAGGGGAGSSSSPQYAVISRIQSMNSQMDTSLLWVTPSLDTGALDAKDAIEVSGDATLWGEPGAGTVYVVSAESLMITEYKLNGGKLSAARSIGLTSSGVTFLLNEQLLFADQHKAYFIDTISRQALELNLDDMSIARAIDLSALAIPGADLTMLSYSPFRALGQSSVTSVFGASQNYDKVASAAKLLFFHPSDGTFELKDSPCGGVNYSVQTQSGDVYMSTDPWVAAAYLFAPQQSPAPCLVHVAPDGSVDEKTAALNDLTGAPTGGLIPAADGTALLRVLPSDYKPARDSTFLTVYSTAIWQTWQIDLKNPSQATRLDSADVAGGITVFQANGHTYENVSTSDFASTVLRDTTREGQASDAGLTMPGVTWGVVQIQ